MTNTQNTYEPECRLEGLERLDLLECDWNKMHEAVQSILESMDESVRRTCMDSRAMPGHNSARAWELFSYRVYQTSSGEVDPVVAGITFSIKGEGIVRIHADISGESLGDVLVDLPDAEVMGEMAVLEKARDFAGELSKNSSRIAEALMDSTRKI